MDTYEEKRSLLLEMIAFSAVYGQLHKRELLITGAFEINLVKQLAYSKVEAINQL